MQPQWKVVRRRRKFDSKKVRNGILNEWEISQHDRCQPVELTQLQVSPDTDNDEGYIFVERY